MQKTRTFIAVAASDDVRDCALAAIDQLRSVAKDVKWVAPENLHWTLQFLGDLDDAELAEVCSRTVSTVAARKSFALTGQGVGAFPKIERPRTLWLGAGQGGNKLGKLQAAIDRTLSELGFRGDRRQYVPHLTLGRLGRGDRGSEALTQRLADLQNFSGGSMVVEKVTVWGSQLERKGPTYFPLAHAPLLADG